MARRLKARSKESVLNRDMSFQTMGSTWFINPKAGNVRVVQPRVYGDGGFAVIRVWPMLDPENPNDRLLNGRINSLDSAGLQGMSMSEAVPAVQYLGFSYDSLKLYAKKLGLSKAAIERHKPYQPAFITARSRHDETDGVPVSDMPYQVLFRTAERLSRSGQEYGYSTGGLWNPAWDCLLPQDGTDKSILTAPKQMVFIVCSVYENGEEFNLSWETKVSRKKGELVKTRHPRNGVPLGEAKDDPLVVMAISAATARKMMMLCNEENENFDGDPEEDLINAYRYGDPTGIFDEESKTVNGGLFFHLYNGGIEKFSGPTSFDPSEHKPGSVRPYDVGISKNYLFKDAADKYKIKSSLDSAQVQNILSKHLFFWPDPTDPADQSSSLLRVSPIDEQAVMIAKALAPVPDFLKCVWADTSYLSIKGVSDIVNRKTVSTNLPVGGKDTVLDSDDDDEFVASSRTKSKQVKKMNADFTDLEDEQDELLATTTGKPVHAEVSEDELFSDDDDDFDVPSKSKAKSKKKAEPVTEFEEDNELEQDDEFGDLDDADDLDADDGMDDDEEDDEDGDDFEDDLDDDELDEDGDEGDDEDGEEHGDGEEEVVAPTKSSKAPVAADDIDDLDALEQHILGSVETVPGGVDDFTVEMDDDLPEPVQRVLNRKRK